MFQNILIVTDNPNLAREFMVIIKKCKLDTQKFSFAISPFSNVELYNFIPNVEIIDLRKSSTVQTIISDYDLIFSIHCKQIFPKELVEKVKCINVHPGYNPINRGWYPQVFAIINNSQIGATIHEIDEKLDHGWIIDRELVKAEIYDTSETLYLKIIQKEIDLLEKNLCKIIQNDYVIIPPENEGNIFLKKDFNKLKEIDLQETSTFMEFINKLRALTHGEYKNGFFIDPSSGKKIYISLNLEIEKN